MAAIAPMKNTVGTPRVWTANHLTVKIGYEIWRNLNGFPPDYYVNAEELESKKKEK